MRRYFFDLSFRIKNKTILIGSRNMRTDQTTYQMAKYKKPKPLRFLPCTMAKTTNAEAKNIKRITYPWKSDLKNSLRIFLWKPIIANKTGTSNKNNCRYSPRVRSGLLQPGANFSKNIPVIPNNKENTKNMIFAFFENNSGFPLLNND